MDNEFAKIFKKLKNRSLIGAITGSVLEPPPNLRVRIDDKIIIEKDQIYVSNHILKGYEREYETIDSKIELEGKNFHLQASPFVINDTLVGGARPITTFPEGSTTKVSMKADIKKEIGKIRFTDTLKKDDMVLLIASSDNQKFFLIDKGVKL